MAASVAFLGTGLMGSPMAINLIKAGYPLTVWNRTAAKTATLVAAGARAAAAAADAVSSADTVVVILENGPVVAEVLFGSGAAEHIKPGALVVDCTSLPPDMAREHAARLAVRKVGHVDAPVSGGPSGAESGTLAVMAGASEEDFARALPILRVFGRPTHVGPPGAGQFAKLCSQWISATAMAAVAEVSVLAAAERIDPAKVRDALTGGFADSKILQLHGQRMQARDFVPGGHIRTFVKDLDAAAEIAVRRQLDLPVGTLARTLFASLQARGGGEYDIAGLVLELERRNAHARVGAGPDRLP